MDKQYSKDSIKAFCTLLITYLILSLALMKLHTIGICHFETEAKSVDQIVFTLPMMSLYLLVFLAATAGYARGKYMLEELPLSKRLKQELDDRDMSSAGIKTKIRAGAQITLNDSFSDVINYMVSSRIPILAVVDDQNNVQGVLTATDLLLHVQKAAKDGGTDLNSLLSLKVNDLKPNTPMVIKADDKLQTVTETMIQHQFSKLIVTKDGKFSGTVDALDIMAELLDK